MPKDNGRGRSSRSNDWGVTEMVREHPLTAAATAAGAAAAGLFLWSRRAQISNQLSNLSDQIGEWTDTMRSDWSSSDDTGGLTTTGPTTTARRSTTSGRTATRGMSETGGGNASLGRSSGGGGSTGSPSGRGRARSTAATQE